MSQPVHGNSQLVWFLGRRADAELAVSADGKLWRADGFSIWQLVAATASDLLG